MRDPMSGEDASGAAESVFSSLGEEWWEDGGVCTLLGCTGMSWSSISMGKYDTLQACPCLQLRGEYQRQQETVSW